MSTEQNTALQTTESRSVAETEATRTGVLISPAVDIFESNSQITLLADMPGVDASDLKVDINEGVLTVTGHVNAVEEGHETEVFREYRSGNFQRKFALSEAIDQERIEAKLTDGVLRLELPKVDRARHRKIEVRKA